MAVQPFRFKKFSIEQDGAAHRVGTDSVLLGAWADTTAAETILDIGTGTGVIALMMGQRSAAARITALDIHPESAALAARNAQSSAWSSRIEVRHLPVQEFEAPDGLEFDLIVSNPPFFSETTISPDITRRLGRHTASLSQMELLTAVQRLLAPAGRFCVILPETEGNRLCELAASRGLYCTRIMEVRSRPGNPVERLLIQLERDPHDFIREQMSIYAEMGFYSIEYQLLTKDFYLSF